MRSGLLLGGRYRLDDRLGFGGMGSVWRAVDVQLGRTVAIKLLRPDLASDAEHRDRFLREARTLAALDVPGIVRIHDWCEEADPEGRTRCYIVIDYVAGRSLAALLEERVRLDVDTTLDVVRQTAEALDAAHRAGIVHRDVKPGNIIIGEGDRVTLVDFGIAYSPTMDPLTEAGEVIGTPSYISPEYLTGGELTPASDVYSLGVVAFQCLAGRPPYAGTTGAVIAGHLDPQTPALPQGTAPTGVTRILNRCLARDPGDRFASASALAAACRAPERMPRHWRVSKRLAVVAGIVALLLVSGGAVFAIPLFQADRSAAQADGTRSEEPRESQSSTGSPARTSGGPEDPETNKKSESSEPKGEPPPQPTVYASLASAQSGKCVGVAGASKQPDAKVIQWGLSWETACKQTNEQWSWVEGYGDDGDDFKLVNQISGLCLTAPAKSAGTELTQSECSDSDGAQVWGRTYAENKNGWDYYRLRNRGSHKCLSNGGASDDGAPVILEDCVENTPQLFRVPA